MTMHVRSEEVWTLLDSGISYTSVISYGVVISIVIFTVDENE
jgi:hypothetical protein